MGDVTQRKQVSAVGDNVSTLVPVTTRVPPAMADGSLHGKSDNLTMTGTGFTATPKNTAVPAISGTAQVGQVVTASTGTWEDNLSPITAYAYQWKNAGVNLVGNGATTNAYTLQATDEGDNITCTVTATNAKGATAATSAAVVPIAA